MKYRDFSVTFCQSNTVDYFLYLELFYTYIAPYKALSAKKFDIFTYFSMKSNVVGTHKKCLTEALLIPTTYMFVGK